MLKEREKSLTETLRIRELDPFFEYPQGKERRALTIFLGYTSNMVTSGLREVFFVLYIL